MKANYEIMELTKENEKQYLAGVVELEKDVLEKMEKSGKIGQLFITGEEGIHEYVESPSNHVMIATSNRDENKVISAVYITYGQVDYTYNDVTKYFKCGDKYDEYVKSKYNGDLYEKVIREVYIEKICGFKYARDIILGKMNITNLKQLSESNKNEKFLELVENERNNPENGFHEKSNIREQLNLYMSLYMKNIRNDSKRYQDFYGIDFETMKKYLAELKNKTNESPRTKKQKENLDRVVEDIGKYDSTIATYDKILGYQKHKIYDIGHCSDMRKYYKANTSNTIEIDTYITHPDNREKGIARILVLEGIKKSLEEVTKKSKSKNIFLVSTLHEDNLSSKYVSEFFGLKDYIFVNRRNGRDRQVHIFGMKKDEVPKYIEQMEKKIAVLYGYNPRNINISEDDRKEILKEQIEYESSELQRLNSIKKFDAHKKYTGYIKCKESKIQMLQELLNNEHQGKKDNQSEFELE